MPDEPEHDPLTELFGEVIHSYTRADALRDGWLIDVTEAGAEVGFRVPVAITRTVWVRYCEWPEDELGEGQSTAARLRDVLLLTVHASRTAPQPTDRVAFQVNVVPPRRRRRSADSRHVARGHHWRGRGRRPGCHHHGPRGPLT